MLKFIGKRLLRLIPVILGVTFITFLLLHISPGDPAEAKLLSQGVVVSKEIVDAIREEMGLNKSFFVQYFTWLMNFICGDLGVSYKDGVSVADKLKLALPATIKLAGASMLLTLIISIPLGILAAKKQNSVLDYMIRFLTFIANSIPGFLMALLLMYFVCLKLKLLPIVTSQSWKGLILPTLSMTLVMSSKYIRQIRAEVLEQMSCDYVMSARARGVKEFFVLYKNVLHNSMLTIITLIGLSVGSLLAGTVVIETIFSWPGLGKLVIDAIADRDYPVIQGFVVWSAIAYVLINLITDISYRLLDPRISDDVEARQNG